MNVFNSYFALIYSSLVANSALESGFKTPKKGRR